MTMRRLIWGVCLVLGVGTLVLLVIGAGEHTAADGSTFDGWAGLAFVVASLAFATVGAVAARVPENPMSSDLAIAGSHLAVAALFRPARARMEFLLRERP